MQTRTWSEALGGQGRTPEEIAAERARRERELLAPRRSRVALLRNLAPFQHEIIEQHFAAALVAPRADALRDCLARLDGYLERRERDPRNAPPPIPEAARAKIIAALEKRGIEPTELAIAQAYANARAKKA